MIDEQEFDIPEWLKPTQEDYERQEQLRQKHAGVDLAQKSAGEKHIAYQETEALLARETLNTLVAEGAAKDQIEFQQRRLAVAYMHLGEFDKALAVSPDVTTTERIQKLQHAADRPDDEDCDCKHLHGAGVEISKHVQTGWLRRNGQIVPIIRCSRCQHVNAGVKAPARADDSRNRDPKFAAQFLEIANRAGR